MRKLDTDVDKLAVCVACNVVSELLLNVEAKTRNAQVAMNSIANLAIEEFDDRVAFEQKVDAAINAVSELQAAINAFYGFDLSKFHDEFVEGYGKDSEDDGAVE